MTTTTSYSNQSRSFALYKTSIKALFPVAIVATILFGLLMPLVYVTSLDETALAAARAAQSIPQYLVRNDLLRFGVYVAQAQSGVVIGLIMLFALVIALVQNNYLYSKKMTDVYHSLPVRRPQLLMVNFLASMTAIFLPFLAVYLVTMLMQVIPYGRYCANLPAYFAYIGMDIVCAIVAAAIIYLFTVCIVVNVGTAFDSFTLTFALGLTPLFLYAVSRAVWGALTYGAEWNPGSSILQLSPFTFVFHRYFYESTNSEAIGIQYSSIFGFLAVWAVIGILLYAAARYCYQRRKSELAGQTQSQGVLQTITKCVGAFAGSALLFVIFFVQSYNLFALLLASLIGSVAIGIIGELILSRGMKSVKKNIKWLAGTGVLFCLMVLVFRFDFLGYTKYVPPVENIESVNISTEGRFSYLSEYESLRGYGETILSDPAALQIITDAHRLAVEHAPPANYLYADERYDYHSLQISYQMKNGRTITRSFHPLYVDAAHKLAELDAQPEFIQKNHALFYTNDVETVRFDNTVYFYNSLLVEEIKETLSDQDLVRLMDAMRTDMLGETYEQIVNPSDSALGYVTLNYDYQDQFHPKERYRGSSHIIVGGHYTNTLSVLSDLGILEQMRTLPQADTAVIGNAEYEFGPSYDIYTVIKPYQTHSSICNYFEIVSYKESYSDDPYVYLTTTEPAEISQMIQTGRNQIIRTGEKIMVVAYYQDEVCVGLQLIPENQLPTALQEQLASKPTA